MFSLLPARFLSASLVLIVLAYNGFATPPAPAPEWNAKFAGREGWIGGDAVYSVKVNADRVLWFFGDTFIGTVKNGRRDGATMVNNTVAAMKGTDAKATIEFFHGTSKDGKPTAILTPKNEPGYYWPLGGAMNGTRLVLFLVRVESTKDGGPFGFRSVAQAFAVIENPLDEPSTWKIEYSKLPFAVFEAKRERIWGSAICTVGDETYVYGVEDRTKKLGSRQLLVVKVPTAKLADPKAWRFRVRDQWSEKADDAVGLANGLATEFSVGPAPGGGYVAVYTESGIGERIVGRFASEPHGPWSEPHLLYSCPEKSNGKVFCYSAKAHHWCNADELLVSYCTNGWKFATSIESDTVYRPQFVRVKGIGRP